MPALTPRSAALLNYPRPEWVSPTTGSTVSSPAQLVFTSVARATASHFNVQVDSQSDFSTATSYRSDRGGFEYSDGTNWYSIPTAGMPSIYSSVILGTSGLVSYWRFSGSSSPMADELGANALTYTTGVTTGQPSGLVNDTDYSLTLLSANLRKTSPTGLPTGSSARTIEGWFKTTQSTGCFVVGYGAATTNGAFAILPYYNNVGTNLALWGYGGTPYDVIVTATTNDGKWHHVVGTGDSTGRYLYLDGVRIGSSAVAPNTSINTTYGIVVGQHLQTGSSGYLNGGVDECAIYSRVLSDSEILYHYNLGKGLVGNQVRFTPSIASGSAYVRVRQSK